MAKNPLKTDVKLDKLFQDVDEGKKFFDSNCDETMVGFVSDTSVESSLESHKITCFYAEKDQKHLYEDQVAPVKLTQQASSDAQMSIRNGGDDLVIHLAQVSSESPRTYSPKKPNLFAAHVPSDVTDEYIETINSNDEPFGWKANPCMLSKTH